MLFFFKKNWLFEGSKFKCDIFHLQALPALEQVRLAAHVAMVMQVVLSRSSGFVVVFCDASILIWILWLQCCIWNIYLGLILYIKIFSLQIVLLFAPCTTNFSSLIASVIVLNAPLGSALNPVMFLNILSLLYSSLSSQSVLWWTDDTTFPPGGAAGLQNSTKNSSFDYFLIRAKDIYLNLTFNKSKRMSLFPITETVNQKWSFNFTRVAPSCM